MTTIAFIGLGNMGGPMAVNLAKAGHAVTAFDLSTEALNTAQAGGCQTASSVASAVETAEVVVSMLPAGAHVRKVYGGPEGVIANAQDGALFIDSSTIDVENARAVIAEAVDSGFAMVDAPVSGGVAAASAGTLTFMVGGEASAFERARPVLDIMGRNIFHAGAAGNGQVAKICNNMLLGISMIGTCEAFHLAKKLGLDAQTFFDISSTASGQSWSMTSYCPAPGPVPNAPVQSRLSTRLCCGNDAKGYAPCPGGRPQSEGPNAPRRASRSVIRSDGSGGQRRSRFFWGDETDQR